MVGDETRIYIYICVSERVSKIYGSLPFYKNNIQDNIQFNFLSHYIYVMIYVRRVFIVKSIFLLHQLGFFFHWKSIRDYYSIHFGLYIHHSTTTTRKKNAETDSTDLYFLFYFYNHKTLWQRKWSLCVIAMVPDCWLFFLFILF